MRNLITGMLAIIAAVSLAVPAAAKQVALVIANSQYEHTAQLANPVNDAQLVSGALRQAGFDTVELALDVGQVALLAQLREFAAMAEGADTALVYFAGHGIESKGKNWLMPVDSALERERDLPFEAVELDLILESTEGAALRIAVLDACRNNPFASQWASDSRAVTRGLAPMEVDDVLVIYAAAPGMVAYDGEGGNSPFALALARRIVQPGLPVQMLGGMVRDDVLEVTEGEQRPFISASITGRPIYLVDGPAQQQFAALGQMPQMATMDVSASATRSVELDGAAWREALELDTAQAYRAYLAEYPEGAFAQFAEANIAQLLDPTATGGEIESEKPWIISLGAALPDRYAVDLGKPLPIDGVWRLSSNNKRIRIERGRIFAVDGWNHALLFRVKPEQVTMINLRREEPGLYKGRDILLNGDAEMRLRADGNLDLTVATFPFPVKLALVREALDDPAALDNEMTE